MRRLAAVFLGTAALLGALATPASADTADTVASVTATAQNLVSGVRSVLGNAASGL